VGCGGPSEPSNPGVDRLTGVDCGGGETPHDGVEADCDPRNEYDYDGDGFVVDRVWVDGQWEDGLALARAWADAHQSTVPSPFPASAALKGGDCDDLDPDIHPGAPGDVPYDGVDTDCDGANDYDADGDGWVQEAHAADLQGYIAYYLDGMPRFHILIGDCDDTRREVHPHAADAPFDGVDANCDGSNDFDQDGDGWIALGQRAAFHAFEAAEGPSGFVVEGFGDCDDHYDFVNPGRPERAGLPRDVDCDGDPLRPRLVLMDGPVRAAGVQLVQTDYFEALLFADGAGLWGGFLPIAPDPRARPEWHALTNAAVVSFGGRGTWTGMEVPFVTAERTGRVTLDAGPWAPGPQGIGQTVWTEDSVLGDTVFASGHGDFACGPAGVSFIDPGHPPIAGDDPLCGVMDGYPVVCDSVCTMWEDGEAVPLTWNDPVQLTGGHAVIDDQVVAADGTVVLDVPGAVDVAVDGDVVAWVANGAVYLSTPAGIAGPLQLERPDWIRHAESPELLAFHAEEVELGSYWGFVSVYVVLRRVGPDGQLGPRRVALARLDP
jgi:hypothetical protein